ncbi:hypothetical protein [Legionella cherrii]|uniref:Coiled-coil protein n=1 Tax=Legionella cherrii TaxID=28084 RepID=A0A0W0SD59_9GAMM|nr:hypothetical protein [Legionella cherrii]KTC80964.1 coiled-coil protein [Legionella cherrii]VEB33951.1 coiled-coil protein [Legionella cherrii]
MGKKATNVPHVNGNNKRKQPDAHQKSQLFFNQKQRAPSSTLQKTQTPQEVQHPIQEIRLQTTTDFLLVAILQELKVQNMIELSKLKAQQQQEEAEKQAAEKMEEQESTRFEEIRNSMYV